MQNTINEVRLESFYRQEQETIIAHCDYCDEDILAGYDYYETDDMTACEECRWDLLNEFRVKAS